MTMRLTEALDVIRQGGCTFAGRARITNWSHSARGKSASFRFDVDPENPLPAHPFEGAYCSPKDGHEYIAIFIAVASDPEPEPERPPVTAPPKSEPERSSWDSLPPSKQAGMRRRNVDFQKWLATRFSRPWIEWTRLGKSDDEIAALLVRSLCQVASCRELDTNPEAADRWRKLDAEYWESTRFPAPTR